MLSCMRGCRSLLFPTYNRFPGRTAHLRVRHSADRKRRVLGRFRPSLGDAGDRALLCAIRLALRPAQRDRSEQASSSRSGHGSVRAEEPDEWRKEERGPRHLPGSVGTDPELVAFYQPNGGPEDALFVRENGCMWEIEEIDSRACKKAYAIG